MVNVIRCKCEVVTLSFMRLLVISYLRWVVHTIAKKYLGFVGRVTSKANLSVLRSVITVR